MASRSCRGSTCSPAIRDSEGRDAAVAQAALALIGTRFRRHGRCAAHGVDCVGLVALALAAAGHATVPPTGYRMRGGTTAQWETRLAEAGLVRRERAAAGAVLLCEAGARQFHLGIVAAGGLVHADAGLGRVVWLPGAPPWPVLSCWASGGEG